jgi:PAS domain-containing protein
MYKRIENNFTIKVYNYTDITEGRCSYEYNNIWKTNGINIVRSNNKSSFDVNNIISMMPGGFFIYINDETERIVLVNEAVLDLYECSTMEEFIELTNQSFKGMVYHEDYSRISKEIVQQISESEKKYDKVKYRIVTKTGKIKKVVDYGHLVTKAYNDDVYYVFIVEEN